MSKKSFKIELFSGIFVLVLGAGLFAGAFIFRQNRGYKVANWVHASATVVDYYTDTSDEDTLYYEIILYTVDGKDYRKRGEVGSSVIPLRGGTREIAYNPDNPDEFVFVSTGGTIFIVMLVAGAAFVFASVLLFATMAKRKADML